MKRTILFFLNILCCCVLLAQESITVTCHIVDAETKESLPYVSIYAGEGKGTLTNQEGNFTINVDESQTLRISCVGYETMHIKATAVPAKLRLKPLENSMQEVHVYAWEAILTKVGKLLNKEYNKRSGRTSQYFMRMTTEFTTRELVEAFVEARSVSNLRDVTVLKGRHGRLTQEGLKRPMIARMNFHVPFEVGPLTRGSDFWKHLVTPLVEPINTNDTFSYFDEYQQVLELAYRDGRLSAEYKFGTKEYNKVIEEYFKKPFAMRHLSLYYDITGEALTGNEGQSIYRINIKSKDNGKKKPILTGTLYVDANTLQLLRFDGQVENLQVELRKDLQIISSNIELKLHINYSHAKGHSEVSDIATIIHSGDLTSKAILYNVDNLQLKLRGKKGKKVGENILSGIDEAGFDEALWAHSNIIQRTQEEERLAGLEDQTEIIIKDTIAVPTTKMGKLIYRLSNFSDAIPQEKVYLHMDNTNYFIGDTIWFTAYTRKTNNDQPSNISRVLYVELYNQDGYMMERKLIDMKNGRGYGNFALPKDKEYYAGYYELRAYTRWQLNWGRFEHWHSSVSKQWFLNKEMEQLYYRDYDKLYSRVFPVYDAPQTDGDYSENMTLRAMRRHFKKDPHKRNMQLALYPEGGNLVEGLPCRIAYEASWDDGEALEGHVLEFNAPTKNRGRGIFVMTPEKGMEREIVFESKDGTQVKAKLPQPEQEGVALQAIRTDSTWRVDIALSPTLDKDSIGVTMMYEGNVLQVFSLDEQHQVLEIPHDMLKPGVNQLTVFDVDGRVWADRLIATMPHRDSTNVATLVTEGIKEIYEPYEKVSFNVSSTQPNTMISLAVRDAGHSDALYDNATMLTEMLLASEVKGFIPNPQWFFEKNDEEHRTGLDLLMMTQGWRRFNWRDMAIKDEWELTEPMEKTPIIKGQVYQNPYWLDQFYTDEQFAKIVANDGVYRRVIRKDEEYDIATGVKVEEEVSEEEIDLPDTQLKMYEQHVQEGKKHQKEVLTHIELVSMDGQETRVSEHMTSNNRFQFLLPGFYDQAYLFIGASDSTKWKKQGKHIWIEPASGGRSPEFAVRLNQPYPRFVKPYHFYQQQLMETSDSLLKAIMKADGTIQMHEVRVGAKRNGQKNFADSIPAFMVDAYEAYNYAIDAGMLAPSLDTDETISLEGIARAYVGDYGLEFPYISVAIPGGGTVTHSNIEKRFGYNQLRRGTDGITLDRDSMYMRENLISFKPYSLTGEPLRFISPTELRMFYNRHKQDKYVFYTDYQPRLAGDARYYGSNLPNTQVSIYLYPDDSSRVIYRDRHYVLKGFAYPDDFYHPNYENLQLNEKPKDYRRTLYWNPCLQLDKDGKAEITLYNNATHTQLSISAEGMASDGTILGN